MLGAGVTSFTAGDIILGGDGSDVIQGKAGDDIIDGDKWLNVRISIMRVRRRPDRTECGNRASRHDQPTSRSMNSADRRRMLSPSR